MNQPELSTSNSLNSLNQNTPHSFVFHPVHLLVTENQSIVAALGGTIAWDAALIDLLPTGVVGLMVELYNNCGQSFQYQINGPQVAYLGTTPTNTVNSSYAGMELTVDLALPMNLTYTLTSGHCQYTMVCCYHRQVHRPFILRIEPTRAHQRAILCLSTLPLFCSAFTQVHNLRLCTKTIYQLSLPLWCRRHFFALPLASLSMTTLSTGAMKSSFH